MTKFMKLIFSAVLLVSIGMATTAFANTGIGTVKTLQGDAFIVRGGDRIPAALGTSINQSDVIETGDDSSVGILFQDETQFSLGANSRVTIDEYVYNADQTGSFGAKLWKGTLGFVTGNLGKNSAENVKIETPMATIGIRGTSFVVTVDEQ